MLPSGSPWTDWYRHSGTKLWSQLEQAQSEIPLQRASWCYKSVPGLLKNHPLIGPTTQICSQLFTQVSFSSSNSPLFPILGNLHFTPGFQDKTFRALLDSGSLPGLSFLDINWMVADLHFDFWKALQLHNFLHSLPPPNSFGQRLTTLGVLFWYRRITIRIFHYL